MKFSYLSAQLHVDQDKSNAMWLVEIHMVGCWVILIVHICLDRPTVKSAMAPLVDSGRPEIGNL